MLDINRYIKLANDEYAKNGRSELFVKTEEAIIGSKTAYYIYRFAKDVKGADINKLQDAIIATNNAEYIYYFALDIEGADINKLQDAIIATKNAEYIYYFARDIEGADISKLEDAIIATGNRKCICEFGKLANKFSEKIFSALFDLDDIGPTTDYLISFKVTDDNVHIKALSLFALQEKNRLWMHALASGNREWTYKIANNFKTSKESTIKLLVKLKKADAIYHYAKFFLVDEEEYRKQLQQALIDSGDVHYIAEFANNITWADKARLRNALKDIKAKPKTLKLEDLVEEVESGLPQ